MTCVIALETATEACSVAFLNTDETNSVMIKRFQLAPREHTKLILPMFDEVLKEADMKLTDVDAIAYGRGPGAFTGLRIATGVAQGLALSVDKPLVPVSSLAAMALEARKKIDEKESKQKIIAAIDARMGEVYWAVYFVQGESIELQGSEQLSAPKAMFAAIQKIQTDYEIIVIGSGWDQYIKDYQHENKLKLIPDKFPNAEDVATLAKEQFEAGVVQSVIDAQPVYLRNQVAEKSTK